MVKNIKKRSVSETEVNERNVETAGNLNKAFKKKKIESKVSQNGHNKQVKKDIPKILKSGVKKDAGPKQSINKKNSTVISSNGGKHVLNNKKNQLKSSKGLKKKMVGLKFSDLTTDDLKAKIELITSRGELTKTAKRKLGFLKKLLRVQGGNIAKHQKSVVAIKSEQVQNKEQNRKLQGQLDIKSKKQNKKADSKQANQFVKKQQKEDEDEDEDEEDEIDSELSEDEVDSDIEEEEESESEEVVEDEEESEDDEEDETDNVQSAEKKESNKAEGEPKKKRYVLFVGNLPYSITSEELKKHFLTKVSHVVNIRIPTKDGTNSRGFAYVELANNTDFEKAYSLNHSVINGRRINVQYSGVNRKEGIAKNFKLNALHKAGKFAGGKNRSQPRNFHKKK